MKTNPTLPVFPATIEKLAGDAPHFCGKCGTKLVYIACLRDGKRPYNTQTGQIQMYWQGNCPNTQRSAEHDRIRNGGEFEATLMGFVGHECKH
jgi:hypothetical protein